MERGAPFPEPVFYSFIHTYLSESPLKELSYGRGGKPTVTLHQAPRGRKANILGMRPGSPKGIVNDIAVTTPVPCSLQHDIFHLGLGRPDSH